MQSILIICYGVNIDQVSANIINKVYIKMMLQHLQHGNTKMSKIIPLVKQYSL